jgi:hypothetical protein
MKMMEVPSRISRGRIADIFKNAEKNKTKKEKNEKKGKGKR